MNAQNQHVADAYQDRDSYAARIREMQTMQGTTAPREIEADYDQARLYRFDGASGRKSVKAPHVAKQPVESPPSPAVDFGVINVGVGWEESTASPAPVEPRPEAPRPHSAAAAPSELPPSRAHMPNASTERPHRFAETTPNPIEQHAHRRGELHEDVVAEEWESVSYEAKTHGPRKPQQVSAPQSSRIIESLVAAAEAAVAAPKPVAIARPADPPVPRNTVTEPTSPAAPAAPPPSPQPHSKSIATQAADSQPAKADTTAINETHAADGVEQQNSVSSAKDSPPFAAAWEVDRFNWPPEVEQLSSKYAEYFGFTGERLRSASQEGLCVLAVASSQPGEGVTTLALCLARAAAKAGARVGLLDGNLQNPSLAQRLGLDFTCGWQATVDTATPLGEAAIKGLEEGITILPASQGSSITSLRHESVEATIRQAATCFDMLIVDAGQQELGTAAAAVDAAIVVRDVRQTSQQQTLRIAASLKAQHVRAVGIAENFQDPERSRAAA